MQTVYFLGNRGLEIADIPEPTQGRAARRIPASSIDVVYRRCDQQGFGTGWCEPVPAHFRPRVISTSGDTMGAPALPVSLSSKISPKFREYERTSTTVANAYVRPIVGRYIERLEAALAERGFENDMFIMQSAGGLVSPAIAAEEPARIAESGSAAGALMSVLVGTKAGESHVVTFDMGGTTASALATPGLAAE